MLHALPQVSGNPCFLDCWYSPSCLRYHAIGYGRRLVKTVTGRIWRMVPLRAERRRLRWSLSVLFIAFYNKNKCCLVLEINCVYASDSIVIHMWMLFWCISNHLIIWYKVSFIKMLYLYAIRYDRIGWFAGSKIIRSCKGFEPCSNYTNEGHPGMVALTKFVYISMLPRLYECFIL